ncbi:MAG TPA: hypothetical protein DEF01_09265, partial [Gemmatimonadetes bacterium]|nr:hypothetical protein [Gemmatimonadota bacterium]
MVGRTRECLSIDFGVYDLVRALCLHLGGRVVEARKVVEEAERQLESEGSPHADYTAELIAQDLASYYGVIGDASSATRWIEFAFDLSPSGVDTRVLGSSLFEPVRNDPRFSQAIDEVHSSAR